MPNPFASQAAAAQAREDADRLRAAQQQAQAVARMAELRKEREQRVLNAERTHRQIMAIRERIESFTQGFIASVSIEFTKNSRKPWGARRIEQAGDYVSYLIQIFVSGTSYAAPEIEHHDAELIRAKFVWGLVLDDANPRDGVTVPVGALVGQHEDWFLTLFEQKCAEHDKMVARRQAENARLGAAEPRTDNAEEVVSSTTLPMEKPKDGFATVTSISAVASAITPKGTKGGRPTPAMMGKKQASHAG